MKQEDWDKEQEVGPIASILCMAVVVGAVYGMKKISESTRGKKLTWKEFLFPPKERS